MFWVFLRHPGVPPLRVFLARASWRASAQAAESLAPPSGRCSRPPGAWRSLGGACRAKACRDSGRESAGRAVGRKRRRLRETSLPPLTLAEQKTSPAFYSDLHFCCYGSIFLFCFFFQHKWTHAKLLLLVFYESSSINKRKKPIVIPEVFTSNSYASLSPLAAAPRCSTRGLEEESFFRTWPARDGLPGGGAAVLSCPPALGARKYQRN